MTHKLGTIWKEAVVAKSSFYPGTFLKGLRKIITILSQDSNPAPSEYKSRELPLS
jgi:hypothetical protein